MASPLTLYVPIKQELIAQLGAGEAQKSFVKGVGPALDALGIVHYARLSVIHNPKGSAFPIAAIILITSFDKNMKDYLNAFWVSNAVKTAFIGLASIMQGGPDHPENFDFDAFVNFIKANNLNKEVPDGSGQYESFYEAYPGITVADILDVFKPKTN